MHLSHFTQSLSRKSISLVHHPGEEKKKTTPIALRAKIWQRGHLPSLCCWSLFFLYWSVFLMYRSLFLLSGSLVLMYTSLFPTCRFLFPTCRSLFLCTFRTSRRVLTERAPPSLFSGSFFPTCRSLFRTCNFCFMYLSHFAQSFDRKGISLVHHLEKYVCCTPRVINHVH